MNKYLLLILKNLSNFGSKNIQSFIFFKNNNEKKRYSLSDIRLNDSNFSELLSPQFIYNEYLKSTIPYDSTLYKLINKITLKDIQEAIDKTKKIIKNCQKENIEIITLGDSKYPYKLRYIDNAPIILYYKGNISFINNTTSIAVIGTRNPTVHGMNAAIRFGEILAENGITVVSGLAKGCDTGGHKGCLNKNGKTVAVLAGGLDKISPEENKLLAYSILDRGGCLLSEYPPYEKPFKAAFIQRDRIQSGLSDGIIVVETGIKSGTMHTVNFSKLQNRYLAVYNHSKNFDSFEQVQGNKKLINENSAIPLREPHSILNFIKKCQDAKYEQNLDNTKYINNSNELTLFN